MNIAAVLTQREGEIAELFAWGAAKKEVADRLFISQRTVENHARNIFEKTGCGKVNELSAWWFCKRFGISFDLSPLRQKMLAVVLLLLFLTQLQSSHEPVARMRTRYAITNTIRLPRRFNKTG